MLSIGKNIKQKNDPLQKISIERFYRAISHPKPQTQQLIEQLRTLRHIDPKAYRKQKTNLPYVVPSLFNPPYRKKENFASAKYLIIDLDHLSNYGMNAEDIKKKLSDDDHIALMFVSPSGDGLKIFMPLDKPCFDSAKYSVFYKHFVQKFAGIYKLNDVLDTVTSDVTRACFISTDENAFFNPDAKGLVLEKYVDFNDFATQLEITAPKKNLKPTKIEKKETNEIDEDVFADIKAKLNPRIAKKQQRKKQIYVPEKLNEIVEDIIAELEKFDISVTEIRNINYGKKFIFEHKHFTAEINVFYGKRGFSVVRSPKSGTNKELMEIGYEIIYQWLIIND